MKRVLAIALWLLSVSLSAQVVTSAEYFWGTTDPGAGNGTAMSAADGTFDEAVEEVIKAGISLPSSNGIHLFNIRIKDEDGNWGPLYKKAVSIENSLSLRDIKVTGAEFFWGTNDPGQGSGTELLAFDNSFDEALESVFKNSISLPSTNGIHLFNIRVKDEDGNWGPLYKKAVSIENSLTLRDIKVTGAEFFWGTNDPGQGSGTALLAFDNSFDEALESVFKNSISLPSANGIHLFNIRVKDEDGNWGPLYKKAVSIENSIALRDLKVTAVEYFWGLNDPGAGNGYTVLAIDNAFDEALESVFKAGVYPPLAGWNLFNIRAADEEGNWGPLFKKPVWADEGTNPIQIQLASLADIPCNGGQDAKVYATIAGGVEPYTISWSNGATNDTIENLAAGKYVITVTDSTGQSNKDSIVITEPNPIVINTTGTTSVSCAGNDGGATFSISGGTPAYYISWSGGITGAAPSNPTGNGYTFSITNVAAGSYTATITDENGCTKTHTVTIPVDPNTLAITTTGVDPTCYAGTDGSISVSNTGGQTPLAYMWSTGSTGSSLSAVSAGTYWVSVTDGNNCTRTDTVVLADPLQPAAPAIVTTDPNCTGSNGSATITNTVSGTAYTWYSISGSTSTTIGNASSLSGLSSGQYSVSGIDANGCATQGATFTLSGVAANLNLSTASIANVTCYGAADGFVNVAVSGGSAPYTYTWDNGTAGSALTGVSGGSYTVTVTDANGCIDSSTVTITEPSQAFSVVTTSTTALTCNGDANASITVNTTGAQGTTTYSWSNGSSGATVNSLSAGTYTVTATDGNNCQATQIFTIADPTPVIVPTISAVDPTCGGSNGTASISNVQSNTSYSWYLGSSTTSFSASTSLTGLGTGSYSVVATDLSGCTSTPGTFNLVDQTVAMTITTDTLNNISCYNGNDGFVNVAISGGVAPYTYAWSNGGSGSVLANVGSGVYTVVVTDNNGCLDSTSITLTAPSQALDVVTLSSSNLSCHGDSTGTITVSTTGAQGSVTYTWSNGATGQQLTGLGAGTYVVTATDGEGCTSNETISITQPLAPLTTSLVSATRDFCNSSSGSLTVSAAGGTSPYLYSWNTGEVSNTISNKASGTYTVTVIDDNGCTQSDSYNIADSTALITINASVQDASCSSAANGSLTVQSSGGVTPYNYTWTSNISGFAGTNSNTIASLSAGTYYLTITDNFGCAKQDTFTVGAGAGISANISHPSGSDTLNCFSDLNGSLLANSTNGFGALTYSWSNGQTNALASGLTGGTYWVTVTDAAGCVDSDTSTIYTPPALSLTLNTINQTSGYAINCDGDLTGQLSAQATGGTGNYSWNWSNGASTTSQNGLGQGTYWVLVQDAKGCTASDTTFLDVAPSSNFTTAVITSTFGVDILCHGDSTGSAWVNIANPNSVVWDNGESNDTAMALNAGTHYVQIIDSLGCAYTDTISLTEAAAIDLTLASTNSFNGYDISCNGLMDGSISAGATGGLGFYAWNWDNGGTSPNASNLGAGFHAVVVTDQAGCAVIDSIELVEPDVLASNWSVDAPLCFNTADGSAILAMYGGVAPYNWTLNGNNTGAVLTNLNDGIYLVSVTDANNCIFSDTLSVFAPDSIITDLSLTQPSCSESSDGEIIISASGGTGSLYYLINNTGSTGMAGNLAPSSYLVQIIDDNGCSVDTIVDLIALRDECLSIPNYFSPNDDGVNDVWNILGIDLANYTLVVFNVTGQELYRTESQNYQPWDGRFNGRVLPDGDYYYVLESEIQQQAGYVTLRK